MTRALTVREVKVMHMPPNPFSARAKKIRMERSVNEKYKEVKESIVRWVLTAMVVSAGFANILLGSLAPYAIRMQERANEALRRDNFMLFL